MTDSRRAEVRADKVVTAKKIDSRTAGFSKKINRDFGEGNRVSKMLAHWAVALYDQTPESRALLAYLAADIPIDIDRWVLGEEIEFTFAAQKYFLEINQDLIDNFKPLLIATRDERIDLNELTYTLARGAEVGLRLRGLAETDDDEDNQYLEFLVTVKKITSQERKRKFGKVSPADLNPLSPPTETPEKVQTHEVTPLPARPVASPSSLKPSAPVEVEAENILESKAVKGWIDIGLALVDRGIDRDEISKIKEAFSPDQPISEERYSKWQAFFTKKDSPISLVLIQDATEEGASAPYLVYVFALHEKKLVHIPLIRTQLSQLMQVYLLKSGELRLIRYGNYASRWSSETTETTADRWAVDILRITQDSIKRELPYQRIEKSVSAVGIVQHDFGQGPRFFNLAGNRLQVSHNGLNVTEEFDLDTLEHFNLRAEVRGKPTEDGRVPQPTEWLLKEIRMTLDEIRGLRDHKDLRGWVEKTTQYLATRPELISGAWGYVETHHPKQNNGFLLAGSLDDIRLANLLEAYARILLLALLKLPPSRENFEREAYNRRVFLERSARGLAGAVLGSQLLNQLAPRVIDSIPKRPRELHFVLPREVGDFFGTDVPPQMQVARDLEEEQPEEKREEEVGKKASGGFETSREDSLRSVVPEPHEARFAEEGIRRELPPLRIDDRDYWADQNRAEVREVLPLRRALEERLGEIAVTRPEKLASPWSIWRMSQAAAGHWLPEDVTRLGELYDRLVRIPSAYAAPSFESFGRFAERARQTLATQENQTQTVPLDFLTAQAKDSLGVLVSLETFKRFGPALVALQGSRSELRIAVIGEGTAEEIAVQRKIAQELSPFFTVTENPAAALLGLRRKVSYVEGIGLDPQTEALLRDLVPSFANRPESELQAFASSLGIDTLLAEFSLAVQRALDSAA